MAASTVSACSTRCTIQCLSDELLAEVFRRLLPHPEIIATRSALAARRDHLTCTHKGDVFDSPSPEELHAANALWRTYLERAELPIEVIDHPLWDRSRGADAFFWGLSRRASYVRVCKRWHEVLQDMVKVVLCGVQDTPPPSTRAVVLSWNWNDGNDDLEHLTDLEKLHTLVICNTTLVYNHGDNYINEEFSKDRTPPPLPWGPTTPALRHLVFFIPPHKAVGIDESCPNFLKSLEEQHHLETLVLPPDVQIPPKDVPRLLVALPDLVTLIASGVDQVRAAQMQERNTLRHLEARALEGCGLRSSLPTSSSDDDDDDDEEEPLADLCNLESLALTRASMCALLPGVQEESLGQLSALTCLTQLSLRGFGCRSGLLAQIAAAPRLRTLTLASCPSLDLGQPCPLLALRSLTCLHLGANGLELGMSEVAGNPSLGPEGLQTIGAITTLESLQIIAASSAGVSALGNLTRLTSLTLCGGTVAVADSRAIAGLVALEQLYLHHTEVREVAALAQLQALVKLRELGVRDYRGLTSAAFARLKVAAAFPRLRVLEVASVLRRGGPKLTFASVCSPGLQHMRHLEDLDMSGCDVKDDVLQYAARLPELRRLVMRFCTGYTLAGLLSLRGCAKLLHVDAREPPIEIDRELRAHLPFSVLTDDPPPQLAHAAHRSALRAMCPREWADSVLG